MKKTTPASPAGKPRPAAKPAAKRAEPAKAVAAPLTPPKAAIVTVKQLAVQFGEAHDLPAKQTQSMLDGVMGMLVKHLKAGDKLRLNGLGILDVKDRPARAGRNPATSETIQIAASRKIAFRPAKELKDAI